MTVMVYAMAEYYGGRFLAEKQTAGPINVNANIVMALPLLQTTRHTGCIQM